MHDFKHKTCIYMWTFLIAVIVVAFENCSQRDKQKATQTDHRIHSLVIFYCKTKRPKFVNSFKSQHMLHFTLFLMNTSISKKFAFVFYFQCFCLSWYTLIFKVHIKFKCPIPLSIFSLMVMWCMMVYPLILYHLGHNPCVLQ